MSLGVIKLSMFNNMEFFIYSQGHKNVDNFRLY